MFLIIPSFFSLKGNFAYVWVHWKKLCHPLVGLHWVVASDHELRRWNIFVATRTCFLNTWHDRGLHSWVSLAKNIFPFIRDIVSDQSSSCCCSPTQLTHYVTFNFVKGSKAWPWHFVKANERSRLTFVWVHVRKQHIYFWDRQCLKKRTKPQRNITVIKSFLKCNPENAWAANVSQFPTWRYIPCVCDDFFLSIHDLDT